jgi:hypothetical protein
MIDLLPTQRDVYGYIHGRLWGVYLAVEYMSAIVIAVGG